MSKLWQTFYKAGERIWPVLPFHSFLAHEGATRPSKDHATYRMAFFHPKRITKHFMKCHLVSHLPVTGNTDYSPLCRG